MMPEAPVRFSTMKFCFSDSVSFAASRRASGSTEPPGGYGETNLTGLLGHSCATAPQEMHSSRTNLKSHIASSFQLEHLARLVRRGDGQPELLENPFRLRHLLGVRLRQL